MAHEKLTYVELSEEKRAEIRRAQAQVKEELPELAKRLRMATEAAEENTFSGELRRAIHASGFHLNYIADRIGTTALVLDEFLTGERTLRSDVIDRLTGLLGCTLGATRDPATSSAKSDSQLPAGNAESLERPTRRLIVRKKPE
jgi:hypothetical protein